MPKVFDRTEADGGWLYHDPDEHTFVIFMGAFYKAPIVEFDTLMESTENDDARAHRLEWRAKARAAFAAGNTSELEVWATLIREWTVQTWRDEYATPLARTGQKFKSGKKTGAISSTTAYLIETIKANHGHTPSAIADYIISQSAAGVDSPYECDGDDVWDTHANKSITREQLIKKITQTKSRYLQK